MGIDKLIAGYGFVDNRSNAMDKRKCMALCGQASCTHLIHIPAEEPVTCNIHNHCDCESIKSMMINTEFSKRGIT